MPNVTHAQTAIRCTTGGQSHNAQCASAKGPHWLVVVKSDLRGGRGESSYKARETTAYTTDDADDADERTAAAEAAVSEGVTSAVECTTQ